MITPIIVSNKTREELDLYEGGMIYHNHHTIPYGHDPYNPTCIICIEYGTLVEDHWLAEVHRLGYRVYNIHRAWPGDYRGASVLNHQILAGECCARVTLQCLVPGMGIDQGPIIYTRKVNIRDRNYNEARKECRKVYKTLIDGAINDFVSYDGKLYKRRKPEDSELLESDDARTIFGKLLAADPDNDPCYFIQGARKHYVKIFNPESRSAPGKSD